MLLVSAGKKDDIEADEVAETRKSKESKLSGNPNLVFNINVSHDSDQILEDYPHEIDRSKP